jgi:hypothetical protein
MPVSPNSYSKFNPYETKVGGEAYLDPSKFNSMIVQYGVRVTHEKSMLCPNIVGKLSTGEHDPNCEICDNGFVYHDKTSIFAVHQSNQLTEYFRINGLWESDTAMITTPSKMEDNVTDFIVHRFDRFVILDYYVRISERLERSTTGSNKVELLKYEAHRIEKVSQAVNGLEVVYVLDTDYKIDTNGNIEWITGGSSPADTKVYSISYYYQPIYLVETMIHEGRYSLFGFKTPLKVAARHPQTFIIKRDYLYDKRDIDTEQKLKEPISYL